MSHTLESSGSLQGGLAILVQTSLPIVGLRIGILDSIPITISTAKTGVTCVNMKGKKIIMILEKPKQKYRCFAPTF